MTADRPGLAGSLRPTRIGAGPMLPAVFGHSHLWRVIGWAVSNRVKRVFGDPGIEKGHCLAGTTQRLSLSTATREANTVRTTTN